MLWSKRFNEVVATALRSSAEEHGYLCYLVPGFEDVWKPTYCNCVQSVLSTHLPDAFPFVTIQQANELRARLVEGIDFSLLYSVVGRLTAQQLEDFTQQASRIIAAYATELVEAS